MIRDTWWGKASHGVSVGCQSVSSKFMGAYQTLYSENGEAMPVCGPPWSPVEWVDDDVMAWMGSFGCIGGNKGEFELAPQF